MEAIFLGGVCRLFGAEDGVWRETPGICGGRTVWFFRGGICPGE